MNNIYLLKKNLKHQENLLEKQIYEDLYEYKEVDNINLQMLKYIIFNNNIELFNKVLTTKKITQKESEILLEKIVEEGDSHLLFFLKLINQIPKLQKKWNNLVEKAMISNSFLILEILLKNKNKLSVNIINKAFEKNPNLKLLNFCNNYINIDSILNKNILNIILNGDYLDVFKYFIQNKNVSLNKLLNSSISHNAYQITYYILNNIKMFDINQKENFYNEFFDFLMTEKFEKVILFLKKSHDLFKFGSKNLEKLLISFNRKNEIECLLFEYSLSKITLKDIDLKNKINKYILENKLKNNLKEKMKKQLIIKI